VWGSFVHGFTSYGVPFGLLTALALCLSIFAFARVMTGSRSGAAAAVAGWGLSVLLLSTPRAEGDLIIGGTPLGYAWLIAGAVVAACCVAWPPGRRAPHRDRGLSSSLLRPKTENRPYRLPTQRRREDSCPPS
jgi:hypothetical protein